jgi:fluoride exporter
MSRWLIVGVGSFFGGIARYLLSGVVQRNVGPGFPWGTMTVNVVGCFCIGAVLHLVEDRFALGLEARLFVAVGILGGFTTFSAFGYETMELLRDSQLGLAALNVAGNVLLGLSAVWLGRAALRVAGM